MPRLLSARSGTPTRARARSRPPTGRHLAYAPQPDGRADPGEVVWTWVAYEDDPRRGKDRPVLVVGREGATLLGTGAASSTGAFSIDSVELSVGAHTVVARATDAAGNVSVDSNQNTFTIDTAAPGRPVISA